MLDVCDLAPASKENTAHFVFLGFASDEGVRRNQGNVGAKEGPTAIRAKLGGIPVFHDASVPNAPCFWDAGDVHCSDGDLEAAQAELSTLVERLVRGGYKPILFGGGHEIAWGHWLGHYRAGGWDRQSAIVNVDAHLDLRDLSAEGKGSSGTPFLQIREELYQKQIPFNYTLFGSQRTANSAALFSYCKKRKRPELDSVRCIDAQHLFSSAGSEAGTKLVKEMVDADGTKKIYLTVCLDAFSTAVAPGVSAPQPLGINPWHVIPLIRGFAARGVVAGFDLAEMCPARDHHGITASLATQLIAHFIYASLGSPDCAACGYDEDA